MIYEYLLDKLESKLDQLQVIQSEINQLRKDKIRLEDDAKRYAHKIAKGIECSGCHGMGRRLERYCDAAGDMDEGVRTCSCCWGTGVIPDQNEVKRLTKEYLYPEKAENNENDYI